MTACPDETRFKFFALFALYACLHLSAPSQTRAQGIPWTSCGTYPATLNVFTAYVIDAVPVISTDRGLYTYDWSTHATAKYNLDEVSATTYWNMPMLTIANHRGLNGRLFAYTPEQGQLLYSDDAGRTWNWTTSPTGAATYTGIAVLDDGVIVVSTKQKFTFGRGVVISTDNGDNWERLTEPHADTGSIAPSVWSCYGSGRHCFYNTELQGSNPGKLITSIDGGKTWVRQETVLADGHIIIGGDDSTVLAYTGVDVVRMNYKSGHSVYYNPPVLTYSTTFTSVTTDGDDILIAGYRYDSNNELLDRSIIRLNSELEVIDSISILEPVRSVCRVGSELWVFFQSRIGKIEGSTITAGPYVVDASSNGNLMAGVRAPGGIIVQSQSEMTMSSGCGVADVIETLSPQTVGLLDVAIHDKDVIFCSSYYTIGVDFATRKVLHVDRNLPKGRFGSYSRMQSVARTYTGRLIGSPLAIWKKDTIPPAIHISDDNGESWRAVTNGWHRRLLDREQPSVGYVFGAKVLETQSHTMITGLANGKFDENERDSGLTGSGLYRSTDNGDTWVGPSHGTPMDGVWIRDLAATDDAVFALSSKLRMTAVIVPSDVVQLYTSENDGMQWREIPSAGLGLTADFRLAAYTDTLFLFDIGPTGSVRYSVDGGLTFKRYWEPESGSLLWFTISKFGAVATTSEGVFIKGTSTSVVEEGKDGEQIQRDFIPWIVVSPVPADDALSVNFVHLADFIDGLISVKMYSMTGDVVSDFTSQVRDAVSLGSLTIDVDCTAFADGVYLIHMAAGRDSLTRKVMIRK